MDKTVPIILFVALLSLPAYLLGLLDAVIVPFRRPDPPLPGREGRARRVVGGETYVDYGGSERRGVLPPEREDLSSLA